MFKSPSFLTIAAVGLVAIGGFFMFQNTMSQAAKIEALKQQLAYKNQAIEAAKEAAKDKDDIANEEAKIDDIDSALQSLNIVRPDSDR